jgi:hypothetical protein
MEQSETMLNDMTVKRKGGTLRKMKKTQSDGSIPKANVVSMNDLFGKQTPGGFGSPVIDMGASFTSTGSSISGEDFNFKSNNPIYVPFDDDGMEIIEEEDHKPYRTNTRTSMLGSKRWTLSSLGSFLLRRSSEKEKI